MKDTKHIAYSVTYCNDFTEPYCTIKPKDEEHKIPCKHVNSEQWIVYSEDVCIEVVRDFLDAPASELTLDEIKQDFGSHEWPISDEKAKEIQEYYNGRLAVFKAIEAAVKESSTKSLPTVIKHPIAEKHNMFSVAPEEVLAKQNDAYVEVKIYEED